MHNWNDLRYFIYVARHKSYSSAAKMLRINHTTVSRRIKALEKIYGVKLFINTTQGLEMTNVAQIIYEKAIEIEKNHNQISRSLAEYNDDLSGEVKVTMPQDIFTFYLSDILSDFKTNHPDIEMVVSLSNDLSDIATKESDIAIRISQQPPKELIGKKISELESAVYGLNNIDTSKPIGVILWEDEHTLPKWAQEHFKNCYCSLRVNNLNAMFDAIESGFGVAAMPRYLPESIIKKNKIVNIKKLNIEMESTPWSIWVLTHIEVRQSARIKVLKDHIIQSLNKVKDCF